MPRGRKSETSEFTTKVVNVLLDTKVFDKVEATGNTILAVLNDFEFKFGARPAKGIATGESRYTMEQCIASVVAFLRAKMNPSSTKYNAWVKEDEARKKTLPSTHSVLQTLGIWPARAIIAYMIESANGGPSIDEVTPQQFVERQKELDSD